MIVAGRHGSPIRVAVGRDVASAIRVVPRECALSSLCEARAFLYLKLLPLLFPAPPLSQVWERGGVGGGARAGYGEPNMDCTIRQATQADYSSLCKLFAEADIYHSQSVPHVFRPAGGPARTPEYVADILANENSRLFVAESEGQVIGLVHVDIREAPDHPIMTPRRYAKVDDLVVGKEFRRFGIGQSLMKRAHQWACERGVHEVELNVWEFNQSAIALYEKLGYKAAVRRMWTTL